MATHLELQQRAQTPAEVGRLRAGGELRGSSSSSSGSTSSIMEASVGGEQRVDFVDVDEHHGPHARGDGLAGLRAAHVCKHICARDAEAMALQIVPQMA